MDINFAEQIRASEDEVSRLKSEISTIWKNAQEHDRDLEDHEHLEIEAYETQIDKAVKRIESLTRTEKAVGAKAVKAQAPGIIKATNRGERKAREKGDIIFKQATIAYLASQHKMSPLEAAERFYSHDADLIEVVKSVVSPGATDVQGWAAELVDDSLQGFSDILRGVSVGFDLLASAGIALNFDGLGAIKIPQRNGTTTDMASGFVGERDAIAVKRGDLGLVTINPYKWAVISTFSKELAMRSTPQIESLIRSMIVADTSTQLDNDVFGANAAVAGLRPAGLINGITGNVSAGSTFDQINQDFTTLIKALIDANCYSNPVIYINSGNALVMRNKMSTDGTRPFREEMSAGNISGVPFIETTNIPSDTHIIVDRSQLASAVGAPEFTASDTATLVEVNEDGVQPDMSAGSYPRSPNTGAVSDAAGTTPPSPVRSLYQTESVALKHVQYLSWHRMRDVCVNITTGVNYS